MGFSLFSGEDAEAQQGNPEFLKVGPFSVFPPQFYLQRNDSLSLVVFYTPEEAGEHAESLVVETSMQTQTVYQLKATGCVLDLEAVSLDHMALNFKENPLSTIHFKVTEPRAVGSKKLRVRNNCAMTVQYHWSLYKSKVLDKISLTGEVTHYCIEPLQGVFEPFAEREFTITFKPLHAESYFEYADLIVDDIPIQAVPNASEELRALLASETVGPSYLGSNTRYPSFPYLQFALQGYGASCEIVPSLALVVLPGENSVSKKCSAKLALLNTSCADARIRIILQAKTSNSFSVRLHSPKLAYEDDSYEGVISGAEESIEVEIESEEVGRHSAYFVGEVEDGNSFSFEVVGSFAGPKVEVNESILNFGLVKANTKHERTLNITNITDIEAEVLVKTSKNKLITFEAVEAAPIPNEESIDKISLCPHYKKLAPLEKVAIQVTLHTNNPETIEDYLIIDTKHSTPQYIKLYAEVQKPFLHLSHSSLDLGITYAGIHYKIDKDHKQAIVLRNQGNLDTSFEVISL